MHSLTIALLCLRDRDPPQATTKPPLPVINASQIARCVTAAMQAETDPQAPCRSPAPAALEAIIAILSSMKLARALSLVVTHTADKAWLLQDHRYLTWITTWARDRGLRGAEVPPPCERRSDRKARSATSTCAMQAMDS